MGARTKARKRALDVLFEAEQRGVEPRTVFLRVANQATSPLNPYTEELVDGVTAHRDRVDELIATYAEGWSLDRMPAVDRNLLRIGVYELLYVNDVPQKVAIDEAVGLASELSTDESPSFINGVLGRIASLQQRVSGGTD
ncbi:MAG: transcription antitermination factor NusB [Candidatus Nanopelagicales bacterium]